MLACCSRSEPSDIVQGPGRWRLSGLAVEEERRQRSDGWTLGQVLVRSAQQQPLLLQRPRGGASRYCMKTSISSQTASASEVTTLWHYTNLFIIIIIKHWIKILHGNMKTPYFCVLSI